MILDLEVILRNTQLSIKMLSLNIQPSTELEIIKLCLGHTY